MKMRWVRAAAAAVWGATVFATQAAGPVVVLPPEHEVPRADRRGEVALALEAWKLAWELGDTATYLRFYDPGFKGDAPSRAQWEQLRAARLANRDIEVQFEQVRTRIVSDTEAEVWFVQRYASGGHRDVGEKRLKLQRTGGAWRITQESWKARPKVASNQGAPVP